MLQLATCTSSPKPQVGLPNGSVRSSWLQLQRPTDTPHTHEARHQAPQVHTHPAAPRTHATLTTATHLAVRSSPATLSASSTGMEHHASQVTLGVTVAYERRHSLTQQFSGTAPQAVPATPSCTKGGPLPLPLLQQQHLHQQQQCCLSSTAAGSLSPAAPTFFNHNLRAPQQQIALHYTRLRLQCTLAKRCSQTGCAAVTTGRAAVHN